MGVALGANFDGLVEGVEDGVMEGVAGGSRGTGDVLGEVVGPSVISKHKNPSPKRSFRVGNVVL